MDGRLQRIRARTLAVVLALSVLNHTATAGSDAGCIAVRGMAGATLSLELITVGPGPESTASAMFLAAEAAALELQRRGIEQQLLELDYEPAAARTAVEQLTADDVHVLAAHPRMLQRAGDLDQVTVAVIVWGLIIAGLVVLAVNGDGFVMVN